MAAPRIKKALQVEITTQEDWEELLQQPGMLVVDAYAAWCGPCLAIRSLLSKIKITLDRDDLVFATAETDSIGSLSAYRNKSEPTFLFYGGGVLVNVLRGCNAPKVNKAINTMLSEEAKIADGILDRKVFIDTVVAQKVEEKADSMKDEEDEDDEDEELEDEIAAVTYGVVVIKPDAVGAAEDITGAVVQAGFEVAHRVERVLSADEVGELHRAAEGTEMFEELVELMTNGPVVALALTKTTAGATMEETIAELAALVGPSDVNQAKEEAPESLRALFGTDSLHNAVDCSTTVEAAARDTTFFFQQLVPQTPRKKSSRKKSSRPRVESTIAIIRPNAVAQKDSILQIINENGFNVSLQKEMVFSQEQVESLHASLKEEDNFESLVATMTGGSSVVLVLERENAVTAWQELLVPPPPVQTRDSGETVADDGEAAEGGGEVAEDGGEAAEDGVEVAEDGGEAAEDGGEVAESVEGLQAKFASSDEGSCAPLYGSLSAAESERELDILFPRENAVIVIQPDTSDETTSTIVSKLQHEGLQIVMSTSATLAEEQVALLYADVKDEEYYNELSTLMTSGPSAVHVLLSRDANAKLQCVLGPVDPAVAKEENPVSIRALYGESMIKNVVYGSRGGEEAIEIVKCLCPEVEVGDDGLVVLPVIADEDPSDPSSVEDAAVEAPAEVAPVEAEAEAADTVPADSTEESSAEVAASDEGETAVDAPRTETAEDAPTIETVEDVPTTETAEDAPAVETTAEGTSEPVASSIDSPESTAEPEATSGDASVDTPIEKTPSEDATAEGSVEGTAVTPVEADTDEAPPEKSNEEDSPPEDAPSADVPVTSESAEATPLEEPPAIEVTEEKPVTESTVSDDGDTSAAETSREPTLEEPPSASDSESTTAAEEGTTSVEVSREGTLADGNTTMEETTSRETTLDGPTSTDVSREGTTTGVSDTDASTTDASTE